MNEPLATSAGNALEVESALRVLRNQPGEERLLEICLALGSKLAGCIRSGGKRKFGGGKAFGLPQVRSCGGEFRKMIAELGVLPISSRRPEKHLPKPKVVFDYPAKSSGFLTGMKAGFWAEP